MPLGMAWPNSGKLVRLPGHKTSPTTALFAARITSAALVARAIAHDLRVEGGFAGKVCPVCALHGTALRYTPCDGQTQQRCQAKASGGPVDLCKETILHYASTLTPFDVCPRGAHRPGYAEPSVDRDGEARALRPREPSVYPARARGGSCCEVIDPAVFPVSVASDPWVLLGAQGQHSSVTRGSRYPAPDL